MTNETASLGSFMRDCFANFADPVLADEAGMKKYRDYLPAQIVVLPEKTRNSEVPMAYLQAARGADTEVARYAFASMLNSLMYQGLGNYDAAVQAFQKDLGDQPTGKLTVWQIYQLQQRSEFQGVEPPFIPGFFTDIKGGLRQSRRHFGTSRREVGIPI